MEMKTLCNDKELKGGWGMINKWSWTLRPQTFYETQLVTVKNIVLQVVAIPS